MHKNRTSLLTHISHQNRVYPKTKKRKEENDHFKPKKRLKIK